MIHNENGLVKPHTSKQIAEWRASKEFSENFFWISECEREARVAEFVVIVGGGASASSAVQTFLAVLIVYSPFPFCKFK